MKRFPSRSCLSRLRQTVCTCSREAWTAGLFSSTNGNVSVRLSAPYTDVILISATGRNKGRLKEEDLSLVDIHDGTCLQGGPISSETAVHLSLYEKTEASAVLHTHPPCLLALEVAHLSASLLELPIYEADVMRTGLVTAGNFPPGTRELASEVGRVVQEHGRLYPSFLQKGAVWMTRHGLCTWGRNLEEALNTAEEWEHLARITLLAHCQEKA